MDSTLTLKLDAAISCGILKRLDPFHDDVLENGYRHCDICFESAVDDIWDGRVDEHQWRKFYWYVDENLTVCENCLDEVL